MKKNIMLGYSAPEVEIFEVSVEAGYTNSIGLPGFDIESDELY